MIKHDNVDLSITAYERIALRSASYNLSGIQACYQPSASQQRIFDNLGRIFRDAHNIGYQESTQYFRNAFYSLANQSIALTMPRDPMLCYSASLCTQIVASYIRNKGFRVALIEPACDSIPGILKAEHVDLVPLPEAQLEMMDTYLSTTRADVVWIILPNNPTGLTISEQAFRQLVETCSKHGVMLVIDFCFRFFSKEMVWDQYSILEESRISYAIIEDTGKTWPSQELKVGILQSSSDIYADLHYYYDNHLLQVSPVVIKLLTELIEDTQMRGPGETIHKVVKANRECVAEYVKDTILHYQPTKALVPFAWLQITDNQIDATQLWNVCSEEGVHILPGTSFFWYDLSTGQRFVRVALSRDYLTVRTGMKKLRAVLPELSGAFAKRVAL